MPNKLKSLVFFGSGSVAAKSLKFLLKDFNIEYVITKNRPVHHRDPAPVEELAKQNSIPLALASNTKELDAIMSNIRLDSQLGVVIDYGVIISQQVINYFKLGIINSHFSLLPEWRGPDPISYALLSGQQFTGVSLMLIDKTMDTGQLIAQSVVDIATNEDNSSLTNKLILTSNDLLRESVPLYINKQLRPTSQPFKPQTYSKLLSKTSGKIDFNKPASVLVREIAAYSTWPTSFAKVGNLELTICKAEVDKRSLKAGKLLIEKNKIFIGCRVSSLSLIEVKPANKQKMTIADFLNGYRAKITNY